MVEVGLLIIFLVQLPTFRGIRFFFLLILISLKESYCSTKVNGVRKLYYNIEKQIMYKNDLAFE